MMETFYAEGNNGGDNISITRLNDDTIRLKVGHCCVYAIDDIVPVEFITAALAMASFHEGGIVGFIESLGWPSEYKNKLSSKVRTNRVEIG